MSNCVLNCFAFRANPVGNFTPINNGARPRCASTLATFMGRHSAPCAIRGRTNQVDASEIWLGTGRVQNDLLRRNSDHKLIPEVSLFPWLLRQSPRVVELSATVLLLGRAAMDVKTWGVPTIDPYYPTKCSAICASFMSFGPELTPRPNSLYVSCVIISV